MSILFWLSNVNNKKWATIQLDVIVIFKQKYIFKWNNLKFQLDYGPKIQLGFSLYNLMI